MFGLLQLLPFLASAQAFFILSQPILSTTRLDPIVNPGSISGHVHSIAGGSNFDRSMTHDSALQSSCTTAPITVDKSNYWIPQLYYYNYKTGGYQAIPVAFVNAYYLPRGGSRGRNDSIRAFPDGLRMLQGDGERKTFDASDVDDQSISYVCLDYSGQHRGDPEWDQRNNFFNHNCPDGLRAQVNFPTCWDGKNVDSADHRSHLAWPIGASNNGGGDCPASHPVKIVQLFYEFVFEVQKFPFNPAPHPTWVWSNGDTTGYGLHADFLNGWPKLVNGTNVLQRAIDECNINNGVGGNLQDCPPFRGLINNAQAQGCQPQNALVAEDVGLYNEIRSLPGNNPMWNGVGVDPSDPNYVEPEPEFELPSSVIPEGYEHIGCISEAASGRALSAYSFTSQNMTKGSCVAACAERGYPLAGVQWGQECYCDKQMRNGASNTTLLNANERCNVRCKGNSYENCGGSRTLDFYRNVELFQDKPKAVAGWAAKQCYDANAAGQKILSGHFFTNDKMTPEICNTECASRGFTVAGVEYGRECRCGASIPVNAVPKAATECSFNCPGDAQQKCGAGNRMNVYEYTGGALPTQPAQGNPLVAGPVTGWSKPTRNCFTEVSGSRTLSGFTISDAQMTGARCITMCQQRGFQYAGTEYSRECFCSNEIHSASKEAPMSECNMQCAGDTKEMCGGPSRLNIYQLTQAAAAPVAQLPANWTSHGCWNGQATGGRAFPGAAVSTATMTINMCMADCQSKGFSLAGIEYGRECRCANAFNSGSSKVQDSDCSMPCAGDSLQVCGNANRMSVYRFTGANATTTASTTSAATATANATTTTNTTATPVTTAATTTVAAPVVSPTPNNTLVSVTGWAARGCYSEGRGTRALTKLAFSSGQMTNEMCLQRCREADVKFCGTEYAGECYGGDALMGGSIQVQEGCNMACRGNSMNICGGANRLTMWESTAATSVNTTTTGASSTTPATTSSTTTSATTTSVKPTTTTTTTAAATTNSTTVASSTTSTTTSSTTTTASTTSVTPSPSTTSASSTTTVAAASSPTPSSPLPSGWVHLGCVTDGASRGTDRAFSASRFTASQNMTWQLCAETCQQRGFKYAGASHGAECFCDNVMHPATVVAPAAECNMPCPGDNKVSCGGSWRLNAFALNTTEAPVQPVRQPTKREFNSRVVGRRSQRIMI